MDDLDHNYINPDRQSFKAFAELQSQTPIQMLNLIRLNDTAVYEDGTLLTGREAYGAYGRESAPIFERVGGKIIWSGDYQMMLIGPQDRGWDIAFIAEYPSVSAFVEMVKDPAYQNAVVHRTVAVKDSRLIRFGAKNTELQFG